MNTDVAKIALVTGAARRIGAAIIRHLHQAGFNVVIHYHKSEQEAHALAIKLNEQRHNSAIILQQNLSFADAGAHLIKAVMEWRGRLDVVVNNASLFKQTHQGDVEYWDTLFTVNVKTPFTLSHAAYPYLAAQQGVIINITDIHAASPLKHYSIYCQTKAALTMQTLSLAKEFAPLVRVNGVAPGSIAWPEQENVLSKQAQEKIIAQTPLKKHGNPKYIAQAVLALVENQFITGQLLAVDGGRSI